MEISIYTVYNTEYDDPNFGQTVRAFKQIAVLPFKSLVWEECYNDIGKMQVVFTRSDRVLKNVTVGNFARISGTKNIMYIHSLKLTDTELWAYGYEIKGLMRKKHALPEETVVTGYEVDLQIELLRLCYEGWFRWDSYDHLLRIDNGTFGRRVLSGLDFETVYDALKQVCALYGAGFTTELYIDADENNLLKTHHVVYFGNDVSSNVRFASVLGNVQNLTYTVDDQNYINTVIVYGADPEVAGSLYEEIAQTASAQQRIEENYNAILDLREEYPKPDDMTVAEYQAALQTRAQMSLIARHITRQISVGNIDTREYGKKYKLGDIVGVIIPELDIKAKMRVSAVQRTVEGNNEKISVSLETLAIA